MDLLLLTFYTRRRRGNPFLREVVVVLEWVGNSVSFTLLANTTTLSFRLYAYLSLSASPMTRASLLLDHWIGYHFTSIKYLVGQNNLDSRKNFSCPFNTDLRTDVLLTYL